MRGCSGRSVRERERLNVSVDLERVQEAVADVLRPVEHGGDVVDRAKVSDEDVVLVRSMGRIVRKNKSKHK